MTWADFRAFAAEFSDELGVILFLTILVWMVWTAASSHGYAQGYVKGWSDKQRKPLEGPKP